MYKMYLRLHKAREIVYTNMNTYIFVVYIYNHSNTNLIIGITIYK